MTTVSEKFAAHYRARREMSDPADLARLFIARLCYPLDSRLPTAASELFKSVKTGQFTQLSGRAAGGFAVWLRDFITLGHRTRGVSFYPLHPLLSRAFNGEEARADGFIMSLVRSFGADERRCLIDRLWNDHLPPFEKMLYDLIEWQSPGLGVLTTEIPDVAIVDSGLTEESVAILTCAREDLLALAQAANGVQNFVEHAGRLLALTLARFFLTQAGLNFTLPIYIAPAADSHEGVRTLAHEIIETHRAHLERALRLQFESFYQESVSEEGALADPQDMAAARALTQQIFHPNANIVPQDANRYAELRREHQTLCQIAYHYYWRHSGASSRFLRQLYAAQLNLTKKAGIANSRSRYSTWHYYWLSPELVETLLLVSRPRLQVDRILMVDLLRDWRERYGLAPFIDESWEEVYRTNFRGLGNPEALNEANQRCFAEILAEHGRLEKNSDDFPWVILED